MAKGSVYNSPFTFFAAQKFPLIGNQIWDTYAEALAYINNINESAVEGQTVSVINDGDRNGLYFVAKVAKVEGEEGVLQKIGESSGSGGDPGSGGATNLGGLNDVTISNPQVPHALLYNGRQWENRNIAFEDISDTPTTLSGYSITDAVPYTRKILAGPGLSVSNEGQLDNDITLSLERLHGSIISATYTKVTIDAFGRVINGSSLAESDIPSISSSKISDLSTVLDAYVLKSTYEEDVTSGESGLMARVARLEDMFEFDDDNNIRTKYNFYSTKQLASGGIGDASGSGLGLILSEWPTDSEDYSKYALGGNLGIELNTRLTAVEGKATNVTVSPTLSQGKPMGTIMVDGVSQTMYAPSKLSQMDADFVDKNLLPYDDGACSLGSASRQWTIVYAEDIVASNEVEALLGEFGDINAQSGVFTNLDAQRLSVYSDFLPSNNNTTNIGSSSLLWRNVYAARVSTEDIYGRYYLGLRTNGGHIFLYDFSGDIDDYIADFSYSGSIVYTDLTVYGALTINNESVATQTWANEKFLPLIGGTITGNIKIESRIDRKIILDNTDTDNKYQFISFRQNGTEYGQLGTAFSDDLVWGKEGSEKIILHSGNIGSYNAGSATKLADDTAFTAWGQTFFENGKPKSISITTDLQAKILYFRNKNNDNYAGYVGRGDPNADDVILFGRTNLKFYTNSTTRMFINSSGNVGIGTTNPEYKLDVNGDARMGALRSSAKDFIIYGWDGTNFVNAIDVDCNNSNLWIGYGSAPRSYNANIAGNNIYLCYGTSRTTGITLNSSGNVGIGMTDPQYKLDVFAHSSRLAYDWTNSAIAGYTSFTLDTTTTGGWDRTFRISHNSTTMFTFGAYGQGGSLTYGYIGGTYANPWVSFDSEKTQFNKKIKIGNAVLSWDSANNALKIEGNVYATGQVASGGVGTTN